MIAIQRDPQNKNRLHLSLSDIPGAKCSWVLTFSHDLDSEFEADLTEAAVRKALSQALRELRFRCYDRGVRDGRGHRPRLNSAEYVSGCPDLGVGI